MRDSMTVQEAVKDMTEIELQNGKLYLCDKDGWIVGETVAVRP